jgi:hypothetical protein
MTTTAIKKTPVEALWNIKKVNEIAANILAADYISVFSAISKSHPELIKEIDKNLTAHKATYFKSIGVKSPIDLAKAKAEIDANVFGSKLEIEGDEKQATITYKNCACFDAMKKIGNLQPATEEKIGHHFQSRMTDLGHEFGFKTEVVFADNGMATVTFKK